MAVRVQCPFCNAATVLPEASAKAVCGRCGESFVPSQFEWVETPGVVTPTISTRSSKSLLMVGVALLGIVAAGLAYWQPWKSQPTVVPQELKPPSIKPPLALDGLKYLSPSSNIAFAIQPAAIAAYAERTGSDVKTVLAKLGLPKQALDSLDRLGIPLTNIDHLAVGVTLKADSLIPGLTLALKLRQPVDEAALMKSLHAEKSPKAGRVIYTLTEFGLPMRIAPVDSTTYLLGFSDDDVSRTETPKPLSDSLRTNFSERLSPASFAWLGTESRNWTDAHPLLKSQEYRKAVEKIAPVRSVTVGLSLEADPTLKLTLELADDAAATGVETAMKALKNQTAITRTGPTVTFVAPATAETMEALTKLASDVWK
ncbi:hypothetical protein BH11PLA2_BH11PLA2_04680 [soil metagenome]